MNILEIIEHENESMCVDFKKTQYQKENRDEFLKDIMSMANANTDTNKRYIIIGVKQVPSGEREFHPIPAEAFTDDAEYQSLVRNNIEPEIKFSYQPIMFKECRFGVFEIIECNQRPYMFKKDVVRYKKGECYIRRGSQIERVNRYDLEVMYEERYKMQRERDIKFSHLHLLRYEFVNNKRVLSDLKRAIEISSHIMKKEAWSLSSEITNHCTFEIWDSLIRSGVIATLDFAEMETYRATVQIIREVIYMVRTEKSKWLYIIDESLKDKPICDNQPELTFQFGSDRCKEAIGLALGMIEKSIGFLKENYEL